jgi:hypothetical protein
VNLRPRQRLAVDFVNLLGANRVQVEVVALGEVDELVAHLGEIRRLPGPHLRQPLARPVQLRVFAGVVVLNRLLEANSSQKSQHNALPSLPEPDSSQVCPRAIRSCFGPTPSCNWPVCVSYVSEIPS